MVNPARFRTAWGMLSGTPEITAHLIKGNTPRAACQPWFAEGDHFSNLTAYAAAFAYRHVTRMAVSGQHTGRGSAPQGRVGAPA